MHEQARQQRVQDLHGRLPEEQGEERRTPPRDDFSQPPQGILEIPNGAFRIPAFEGQFPLLPLNACLSQFPSATPAAVSNSGSAAA